MDRLVAAAAAGSHDAWRQIVEEFGSALRGFARARGVSEPDELTQDVFVDVARNIASFDGDRDRFRSWVFTIAYRRVADHHRRSARSPDTVSDDRHMLAQVSQRGLPEHEAERAETLDEVLAALEGMKELERDVLILRFIAELSSDQIAAVVGKSPGNVRVIQNRALDRVRRNLEKSRNDVSPRAIAPVT